MTRRKYQTVIKSKSKLVPRWWLAKQGGGRVTKVPARPSSKRPITLAKRVTFLNDD